MTAKTYLQFEGFKSTVKQWFIRFSARFQVFSLRLKPLLMSRQIGSVTQRGHRKLLNLTAVRFSRHVNVI